MMTVRRDSRGLTLIELIVAVAIFAVVGSLSYGGLRQFLDIQIALTDRHDRLAALETALIFLQSDVENIVGRSVRDEFGSHRPALQAQADQRGFTFTRYTADNQSSVPNLVRVSYNVIDGQLLRMDWPTLDSVQGVRPNRRVLMGDVSTMDVRFYGDKWESFWPTTDTAAAISRLPRAMEIRLTFSTGESLRRVIRLGNRL